MFGLLVSPLFLMKCILILFFQAEKGDDESLEDYCIRYFARFPFEDKELYVARVFHKYENEDVNGYLLRVRTIMEVFNTFNGWYNLKYLNLTKQYFTLEYQQQEDESRESYYKRILSKKMNESFDLYRSRIKLLIKLFPKLDLWQGNKEDRSKLNDYTLLGKPLPTRNKKPETIVSGSRKSVSDQSALQATGETEPLSEKRTTNISAKQLNTFPKPEAATSATSETGDESMQLDSNLKSDSASGIDAQNTDNVATSPEKTETNSKAYSAAETDSDTTSDTSEQPNRDTTKLGTNAEIDTSSRTNVDDHSGIANEATNQKQEAGVGAKAEVDASSTANGDADSEIAKGATKQTNREQQSGATSDSATSDSQINVIDSKPVKNLATGSKTATTDSDLEMPVTPANENSNILVSYLNLHLHVT